MMYSNQPDGGVEARLGALLLLRLPFRVPDFKVPFIVDFMLVSWLYL